ncbi:hypothetical protein HZH68_012620 [Vespula germanica]|uniref:Uncharacterized protein n=1 Tax=Vespula germanica TaxID=30212 RepID=A0A834JHA6_VESGE|nr:hypothetical protein HZH68_012620 [Vespula germanica]
MVTIPTWCDFLDHEKQCLALIHINQNLMSTVQRQLNKFGLRGVTRRKPFISLKNRKASLKSTLSGLRRRIGEKFNGKCLTVKRNYDSIMVWVGMTMNGPGPICRLERIINHVYVDVLDPLSFSSFCYEQFARRLDF